ncbi:MAG: S8 family serine peptidase, partial [Planctomycetaceae bacterium]|nr:S8 family serine peptidase [Planctomycetaceae bacterium]
VYTRTNTAWNFQQTLLAPDPAASDLLGISLALDGDTLVAGACLDDDRGNESGSAYVFQRFGDTWSLQEKLTSGTGDSFDQFGRSVAISGNTIAAGSYLSDAQAENAGAVSFFEGDARSTPFFKDVRIENHIDMDGDFFLRAFDILFDVNSFGSGSYYVTVYEDDVFFDDMLVTSGAFPVTGNAVDYRSVHIVTDGLPLGHGTAEFKLVLHDFATGRIADTWTQDNDADLGNVQVEFSSQDIPIFNPYFRDINLTNFSNPDGDDYFSQFAVAFDVDTALEGDYYVRVYRDDFWEDLLLATSPVYTASGTDNGYESLLIDVQDVGLEQSIISLRVDLVNAFDDAVLRTWTSDDDAILGSIPVEPVSDEAFAPQIHDVRISNVVDKDGDGFARSLTLDVDISSPIPGNASLRLLHDGVFIDTQLLTTPNFSITSSLTYQLELDVSQLAFSSTVNFNKNEISTIIQVLDASTGAELSRFTGRDDDELRNIPVEIPVLDRTLGEDLSTEFRRLEQGDLASVVEANGYKHVFAITVGGSIGNIAAELGATHEIVQKLLGRLKHPTDIHSVSLTLYFDLADLLRLTNDGLEGWATVWVEAGYSYFTLSLPIDEPFVGFGIVPFGVEAKNIEDDSSRGWGIDFSAIEANVVGQKVYALQAGYNQGFSADWGGRSLEIFTNSTNLSASIGNARFQFAPFDINIEALAEAAPSIVRDVLFQTLVGLGHTYGGIAGLSLAKALSDALTGEFAPFIRPASSGTDSHADTIEYATFLPMGTAISGEVGYTDTRHDHDLFRFKAPYTGEFRFVVTAEADHIDTAMALRRMTGETILSDDDSGRGFNPLITYSLEEGREYIIDVYGANASEAGDYELIATAPPGILIFETDGGTHVAEAGGTDTFSVVLTSRPDEAVVIVLRTESQATISMDQNILLFDRDNWNAPQLVTLTSTNDGILNETRQYSIDVSVYDSVSDIQYQGVDDRTLTVVQAAATPAEALYFSDQWNLRAINLSSVWDAGIFGSGIVVGVVDGGIDIEHADLIARYRSDLSYDFVENDSVPLPNLSSDDVSERHGTPVAGLIGAGGIGVSGVAPAIQFAALRGVGESSITISRLASALDWHLDSIDIYNNSWTYGPQPVRVPQLEYAVSRGVVHGRDGAGAIYVFAAGNDALNANAFLLRNVRETIVVGAIDQDLKLSSYSNWGPNVLVVAPGGGLEVTPNVLSTDNHGASGYNDGQNFDLDADYTDQFNGTSAAAPEVSGMVALILEAREKTGLSLLSWRDIQHILVNSSAVIDRSGGAWIQNNGGAGHWVSPKYGFGLVDASAAVDLARTWTPVGPEIQVTSGVTAVNEVILNDTTPILRQIEISENIRMETVEVTLSGNHSSWGDLEVMLESPSGTRSYLATVHDDDSPFPETWTFKTVRNWGEVSAGTWTLSVWDRNSHTESGTPPANEGFWESFELNVFGTELLPDQTAPFSSVQPLPATSGSAEIVISVTGADPDGPSGVPASGVDHYDLYVAVDNGTFTYWISVPAESPSATYLAQSDHRYWFRSIAVDGAGNEEPNDQLPDAHTYVGDVDRPVTSVTAATPNLGSGLLAITARGSDPGSAELSTIDIFVALDSGTPQFVATLPAGTANATGYYSVEMRYQGLTDGLEHTYVFYSVGKDASGNVEDAPVSAVDDVSVTATFAAASALQATAIDVQKGATQRSYIRYLDIMFNSAEDLQTLIDDRRIRIERFNLSDGAAISGTGDQKNLDAVSFGVIGNQIRLDFNSNGIGGNRNSNAGDGMYRVELDLDGDGQFDNGSFEFARIFGDTDGDGDVDTADVLNVNRNYGQTGAELNADINGDGIVNILDRIFTYRESTLGKQLHKDLFDLLDD